MGTGLWCRDKTRRKPGKEAAGKGQLFPQGWESGKGSEMAAVPMKGTFFPPMEHLQHIPRFFVEQNFKGS